MTNEQILSEMNDVHEKLDRCLCIVETHMEALQVPHVRLNEAVSWLRDAMRDVRRVRSSITAEPYKKKRQQERQGEAIKDDLESLRCDRKLDILTFVGEEPEKEDDR